MAIYSKQLSANYIKNRDKHTATDAEVFTHLERMGLYGKRILDFGCGDGRYSFEFIKRGAESVVGVDVSPAMIDFAKDRLTKETNTKISFIEADGVDIPFENDSFDLVFSNFVLHHFTDVNDALSEVYRVLSPDGHFVATFSSFDVAPEVAFLIGTEVPLILGSGSDCTRVQDILRPHNDVERALTHIGFDIQLSQHISNPFVRIDPSYLYSSSVNERTILAIAKKS